MSKHDERVGPQGLPYRPCAGVVLVNDEGLVFAGHRIDNPSDAWQMPQGGIDKGETPHEAALRELTEETGVPAALVEFIGESPDWLYYDLPDELVGKIWKGKYGGQRQKWFLMRFKGQDSDISIETEIPEFDRWQWTSASELVEKIVPFKRDVYAAIIADFRNHLA